MCCVLGVYLSSMLLMFLWLYRIHVSSSVQLEEDGGDSLIDFDLRLCFDFLLATTSDLPVVLLRDDDIDGDIDDDIEDDIDDDIADVDAGDKFCFAFAFFARFIFFARFGGDSASCLFALAFRLVPFDLSLARDLLRLTTTRVFTGRLYSSWLDDDKSSPLEQSDVPASVESGPVE